jgi:aryl-alcohol dehydrogenase-like predicted oxidoreductase
VIEAALAGGLTYFESARAYAGSERYYGATLGTRRAGIFLASKAHDRSRRGALAMLETTLRTLGTDVLDLWQLHDVREPEEVQALEDPDGAYAAFVEAKERGLVRYIGVTGHHAPEVLRAALERVPFDAVLLPVNPAEGALPDGFERTVIPAARQRGMAVIGMKVLAHGLLLEDPPGLSAEELIGYALAADVDTIVVGCDDPQQVRAALSASLRPFPGAAERRACEARVGEAASRLAYYRANSRA